MPEAMVVFGWHVFKMKWPNGGDSFAAGHHAVIEQLGTFIDVTPQDGAKGQLLLDQTLFVPDSRVPFDYEQLRTVPALHWSPKTGQKIWSSQIMDPKAGKLPRFGVIRLEP